MSALKNNKSNEAEVQEKIDRIDFKMVTFALAGKDYGIDIMKVREIAKGNEFTYVPNTAAYVRGVYNLRGEIISIIDLRLMFNLPTDEKSENELENMIFLRLDDNIIGVIVDATDKVIGINSESVQPPHPLFGDINVKYISGVVENKNRLYIVLDVERIFGEEAVESVDEEIGEQIKEEAAGEVHVSVEEKPKEQLDLTFISETLATFRKFYVSIINDDWVQNRYAEWDQIRKTDGKDIQLSSPEDADEFLRSFFSTFTGQLFSDEYMKNLSSLLPEVSGGTVTAWNPGCGKGYESFSLACLLKSRYPEKKIKIWGHDNDLLSISSAPNFFLPEHEVPESLKQFTRKTKSGNQFIQEIKESILFEYHDITNANSFPMVDVIFARDILSFLKKEDLDKVIRDLEDKLKPSGVVIIGENERLDIAGWSAIEQNNIVAHKKE